MNRQSSVHYSGNPGVGILNSWNLNSEIQGCFTASSEGVGVTYQTSQGFEALHGRQEVYLPFRVRSFAKDQALESPKGCCPKWDRKPQFYQIRHPLHLHWIYSLFMYDIQEIVQHNRPALIVLETSGNTCSLTTIFRLASTNASASYSSYTSLTCASYLFCLTNDFLETRYLRCGHCHKALWMISENQSRANQQKLHAYAHDASWLHEKLPNACVYTTRHLLVPLPYCTHLETEKMHTLSLWDKHPSMCIFSPASTIRTLQISWHVRPNDHPNRSQFSAWVKSVSRCPCDAHVAPSPWIHECRHQRLGVRISRYFFLSSPGSRYIKLKVKKWSHEDSHT